MNLTRENLGDHPYPYALPPGSDVRTAADITAENVHMVVPDNKFDTFRIGLLSEVEPAIWIPILPKLLDWTCDPHWPSSQEIYPILRTNPTIIQACIPLVEQILDITLDGRDDEHQNALICVFVRQIDVDFRLQMFLCLKRFLGNVTDELNRDWDWREDMEELIGDIEDATASPTRMGFRSS